MYNVFLQQPYFNISGKKIFGLILRKDEKFLSLIHLKNKSLETLVSLILIFHISENYW